MLIAVSAFWFLVWHRALWQSPTELLISEGEQPPGLYVSMKVIDLGLLAQQEFGTANFELTNRGASPLRINDIVVQCGCTIVNPERKLIEPGETLTLPVTINASLVRPDRGTASTLFRTDVIVRFDGNSPNAAHHVRLRVVGAVQSNSELVAIPGIIDLGQILAGTTIEHTVEFQGPQSLTAALPDQVTVDMDEPTIVALRHQGDLSGGFARKQVKFTFKSSPSKSGAFNSAVVVTVDGRKKHRLMIPIRGEWVSSVTATPARLFVTIPANGSTQGSMLRLRTTRSPRQPVLANIVPDLPIIWHVEPANAEGEVDAIYIRVVARDDLFPGSISTGTLRIELASPSTVIDVPVVVVRADGSRPPASVPTPEEGDVE